MCLVNFSNIKCRQTNQQKGHVWRVFDRRHLASFLGGWGSEEKINCFSIERSLRGGTAGGCY